MKMTTLAAAMIGLGGAVGAAPARSAVEIYGVLDTAVEHLRSSTGQHASLMKQTGHVPSRVGLRGREDLGNGMQARFELESGLGLDSGSLLQGGRMFGRSAYVGLGSRQWGEVRLGRQLSLMQGALAPYDPDHFSPYSPALAMQLSDLSQTSLDNVASYWSPTVGGFALALAFASGENAPVAPNPGAPQVVGPGTARHTRAALLTYRRAGLSAGVAAMALVQAMVFSFLERMGMDRGFGAGAVTAVLIALGIVNLFPAPLAAVLEQRWPARAVLCWGPLVQASLALLIAQGTAFPPYAAGALFFSAAMIFTHTFAFGVLARLEPSGRLVAATPAMLMTGSAIGPFLGGTLVKSAGYGALGWAAAGIAGAAVLAFHLACRRLPSARTLART